VYAALTRFLNARGQYRVVTDVGQHQMWAAQLMDWLKPRTHITSGGAGTMGFAVPAAMGVAIANPTDTVWAICGDGGFQMTNQEMQTIMQEGLKNVKVAVINNGYLGMVRQWQEMFWESRYSGTSYAAFQPSFENIAKAYGMPGVTITQEADLEDALRETFAHDGPALIDVRTHEFAKVFPMVPQGKGPDAMIVGEAGAVPRP
jgi:acetolactate synthase-1/2/3 large subunit